ncbi:hypothetical protein FACS189449_10800 [Alphaproteobacteria bacterium]|nr:hypothetical protein FACS189449_10800 [Alphaproteobacteria bacterium]
MNYTAIRYLAAICLLLNVFANVNGSQRHTAVLEALQNCNQDVDQGELQETATLLKEHILGALGTCMTGPGTANLTDVKPNTHISLFLNTYGTSTFNQKGRRIANENYLYRLVNFPSSFSYAGAMVSDKMAGAVGLLVTNDSSFLDAVDAQINRIRSKLQTMETAFSNDVANALAVVRRHVEAADPDGQMGSRFWSNIHRGFDFSRYVDNIVEELMERRLLKDDLYGSAINHIALRESGPLDLKERLQAIDESVFQIFLRPDSRFGWCE